MIILEYVILFRKLDCTGFTVFALSRLECRKDNNEQRKDIGYYEFLLGDRELRPRRLYRFRVSDFSENGSKFFENTGA